MHPRLFTSKPAARRALAAITVLAAGLALTASPAAQAQSGDTQLNTVLVSMTGQVSLVFDKQFVKTLSRSKATISVKSGATYVKKTRAATLPVNTTSSITLSPASTDVGATGAILMRRKDGRKITVQDVSLRLRPTGADLGASLRGRTGKQFAALFAVATTRIEQQDDGYVFVDVPMLVSNDLASAAKQAKIKNVRAGQIMGMMTAEIHALLPTFQLPTLPGLPTVAP